MKVIEENETMLKIGVFLKLNDLEVGRGFTELLMKGLEGNSGS